MVVFVKAGAVNTNKSNSIRVNGVVDSIYEGGVKDLVFKLKNDENIYYINRALENGFDLKTSTKAFKNQEVSLWYAKHRSRIGGHLVQVKIHDSIIYCEWETPLNESN